MERGPEVEQRIAFFGGSFDPPHLGHLAIARAARDALCLDTVLFAPVGVQPLKPAGSTASFDDRVEMTRRAIAGEPAFELSLLDAPNRDAPNPGRLNPDAPTLDAPNQDANHKGRPNYTIDTLRELRRKAGPRAALFCLMGADSFASLRRWYGGAEMPFAATLIVASRPGLHLDDLAGLLGNGLRLEAAEPPASCPENRVDIRSFLVRDSAGRSAPFYLLPGLDVEISASAIRAQSGSPALVPPAVSEYIRAKGLYR